ncbi:MAG: hypothetical protein IM588_11410 [Cytophagales bacterium]|nr:hypothetical protein [Cytophagales bacterium]
MRLIILTIIGTVLIVKNTFSQLGPLSGSQPKSFSTVPDNLGFLENSINAFTGQVQFSIPIMSIGSQGSLSYPVSASYSSAGMENMVSTWNRESPTSVLGLGWSMSTPRIIADHKGTGTRKDDEFFLVEGGATFPLLAADIYGSSYYTENYTNWKIDYNEQPETWIITKEDGTTFIYGDQNSGRKTVRYMVKWGNWIGNSSQPINQSQTAYIWDLSEIKDTWGNQIVFEYQQTEEYLSAGNGAAITTEKMHTKASYIKEIRNTYNEKIVFQYIAKQGAEFKDPHNERPEPDPYQEKYETLALDKVESYIDNALAGEVRMGYSSIGTGELTKRILTSITQFSRLGNALPGFLFSYELLTGANFGVLKQVTSPIKGTATFSYTKVSLDRTNLSYTLPAITNFTEPQIYFGNDYVVITRRDATGGHVKQGRQIQVDVLTWDGGTWVHWVGTSIPSITLKESSKSCPPGGDCIDVPPFSQEYKITLGTDFFVILPNLSATIYLFKKNVNETGQWTFDNSQTVVASSNSTLLSGTDFVFVGTKEGSIGDNHSFTWTSGQWLKQVITKGFGSSQYFYTAGSNYVLTHEDINGTSNDRIKIDYKQPTISTWSSTAWQSIPGTYGDSRWHGSNSYAVMMAAGGTERIYNWDEYYNISPFNMSIAIDDNSFVNNVNNSMVFLTSVEASVKGLAWRYDGINWVPSGDIDFYGPNTYLRNLFSLGDDFVLRPRPGGNTAMRSYDPATRTWGNALEVATTNPYVLLAGNNFVTTNGRLYFKNVDAVDSWLLAPQTVPALNGLGSDFYLQGGLDFIATGVFGLSNSLVVRFKNGELWPSGTNPQMAIPGLIKDRPNVLFAPAQVGYNAIVTALGGVADMEDASSLKIYRKWGNSFEGSISVYVATQIEMNDGASPATQVSYEYYLPTAAADASGTVPQFSRVKTYRGLNLSNGYTDTYFFNGLNPANFVGIDPNILPDGSFVNKHKKATGTPYKTITYNGSNGGVLASSNSRFSYLDFGLSNRSYSILPTYSSQNVDGQTLGTNTTYSTFATARTTEIKGKLTTFQYYYDVYTFNPFASRPRLVPVREEVLRNGQTLAVSCTRWKDFGSGFIAPYQTYAWKNGSTDFSAYWDPNTTVPSANWRLTNTNVSFNSRGLLTQSIDGNNVWKSIVYHSGKPLVLAEVTKASSNQILYEGFEYSTSNFSIDALTGLKSSTVGYTVNLPSGGTYKLTYWRKVGAGNWELITQTINGNTTIGGTGILIDEVRLCPSSALMTTYCYDQWGNLITTCDTNNQVSYFEYDEYNRPKLVRDESRNIVSYSKYNIKN